MNSAEQDYKIEQEQNKELQTHEPMTKALKDSIKADVKLVEEYFDKDCPGHCAVARLVVWLTERALKEDSASA